VVGRLADAPTAPTTRPIRILQRFLNGLVAAVFVTVFLELVGQPPLHRTKGIFLDGQSNPSAAISP
jgi:hypothetical protein